MNVNLGTIRADEMYTLQRFKELTGMGAAALRVARRNGLKIRKVGRRKFVVGVEAIEHIKTTGKAS